MNNSSPKCDIVFSKRANLFRRFCLFCIFVTNTIYVIKIEMLGLVSMASNLFAPR